MIEDCDRVCGSVGKGDKIHGPATLGDVRGIGVCLLADNEDSCYVGET